MAGKHSSIWILNLFLLFLVLVSSGSAATLTIPNTSVLVGTATVQIPININGTGIAGQQFTVTFDPAVLQPTSAIKGTLDSSTERTSRIPIQQPQTLRATNTGSMGQRRPGDAREPCDNAMVHLQ